MGLYCCSGDGAPSAVSVDKCEKSIQNTIEVSTTHVQNFVSHPITNPRDLEQEHHNRILEILRSKSD